MEWSMDDFDNARNFIERTRKAAQKFMLDK